MKKIMMHPNPLRDIDFKTTRTIAHFLRKRGVEVTIPNYMIGNSDNILTSLPFDEAVCDADMVVSLGGDGSILHASKKAAEHAIPILGVNIGHMGYMAELEADEVASFEEILNGNFSIEERMMIDVSIIRNDEIIYQNFGLNDAVIARNDKIKIIDLDLYADEFFISQYCGDGVIVATPTGSTAYSMSAGGPIVDPISKNLIITPLCSHSLTAKPVILSPNRTVSVQAHSDIDAAVGVSVDGEEPFKLSCGDRILIKKSQYITKLVRVKNKNFYDILCTKLLERRHEGQ